MYRDQFGEFPCGYWGLKGYSRAPRVRGQRPIAKKIYPP